jgi:type I restriction enzyme S subunit
MSNISGRTGDRLGDYFNQRQEPGQSGLPVMSVTMNDSLVLRESIERRLESALRPDQHLLVRKGDIAYNMMRMWQGACGLAQADGIVSPAYVVLEPKPCIDSRFAYHWFKSARMIYLFWAYSHGLTEDRLRLYFDNFCEIPATPPPLGRQKVIADVLDLWDEAIFETERLIAQKRQRKKALVSLLFSKLPKRPFSDAVEMTFSGVDKKTSADETSVLLCNYMDVFHNTRITSRLNFMRATASQREIENQRLYKNDVVFTKDSETPEEIAEPALVAEDIENLICGYHLAIARPRPNVSLGPFIAQAMSHPEIRWQFRRLANGVVRFGLTLEAIEAVEIFLPDLRVQEQIAGVLDSEDLAIEALVKSVELLQAQKRGVVQRLLDEICAPSDPVDITSLTDGHAVNNERPYPKEVNGR